MEPRLADDEPTAFLDDFNARQIPSAAKTGAAALRAAAADLGTACAPLRLTALSRLAPASDCD